MTDRVAEIAPNVFCLRVSPSREFSYNSFLLVDEKPTLIHTGRAKYFDRTRSLLSQVISPDTLAYIALSHFEADECGALSNWLSVSSSAVPLCTPLARASVEDLIGFVPRCVRDGEVLQLGSFELRVLETPHFPHGWDAGLFYEQRNKILFSSDIGAQPGDGDMITGQDVSLEALQFQRDLGFLSEGLDFQRSLERVSELELSLLATQHGSLLAANAAQSFLGALKRHISEPRRACDTRKPTQCEE